MFFITMIGIPLIVFMLCFAFKVIIEGIGTKMYFETTQSLQMNLVGSYDDEKQ